METETQNAQNSIFKQNKFLYCFFALDLSIIVCCVIFLSQLGNAVGSRKCESFRYASTNAHCAASRASWKSPRTEYP